MPVGSLQFIVIDDHVINIDQVTDIAHLTETDAESGFVIYLYYAGSMIGEAGERDYLRFEGEAAKAIWKFFTASSRCHHLLYNKTKPAVAAKEERNDTD